MTHDPAEIEVNWNGPYSWPKYEGENHLPALPEVAGVYLQTFEYRGGYLIYAAGQTRRPTPTRFREHTSHYLNGDYNVLDVASAQEGVRKEVWHGWGYARTHRDEFEARKQVIIDAVRKQLRGFRIFLAAMGPEPRMLERLEAAIMNTLYQQPPPLCDIPDRGMYLAPRWPSELPILVKGNGADVLHGLPSVLEI